LITVQQTRLIRSIEAKAKALPAALKDEKRAILIETMLIGKVYGGENSGLTYELALADIHDRIKELETSLKERTAA
jgi:hypothetical protein